MDIRKPGAPESPPTRPTSETVTSSAPAASAKPAAPRDGFEHSVGETSLEVLQAMTPPAPLTTAMTDSEARGAAAFAGQLETLGPVRLSGEDLLTKFLQLQAMDDKVERLYDNNLEQGKHILALLSIDLAKKLSQQARDNPVQAEYLRSLIDQIDRDLGKVLANLKKTQQKTLEATVDKKDEKDEKNLRAVHDLKKKGQTGKTGLINMSAEIAAGVSSMVAAEQGGVGLSMLSVEQVRGDVMHSIENLVARRELLIGRQRS